MARRPRLAVVKFASCDGCQLTLLDAGADLLGLGAAWDIAWFPEASSRRAGGRYDVTLVEGSISTPAALEHIRDLRARTRTLVAIGACATAGGIQALRNFADHAEFAAAVYARPDYVASLATATPIASHVPVDFELRGCPIDRRQLVDLLGALHAGRKPTIPAHSVCVECKAAGRTCVLVAHGTPCLGPVTQAGCGALCPGCHRGCYGCFGSQEAANAPALGTRLAALGASERELHRLYRTFNAGDPTFRAEADRHDD